MTDLLKGNFQTKSAVKLDPTEKREQTLEERFEQEALSRLGGSIAFVSKRKVMWDDSDV